MSNNTETTYEDLEATDVISVELVPERKGLILKHCEYYVSSRRHGTTVTRRYNEFVQLYDILYAKYPYRAVCRLPPKRVVVGGGSVGFLRGRRAALQRWLTLAARHPVLAHDADLRAFLCEPHPALEKPKHDEFQLAGTQTEDSLVNLSIDEMQAQFLREQEQLKVLQLGLSRLSQIFAKVQNRCVEERASFQELGAGLQALGLRGGEATIRGGIRERLADAAQLAIQMGEGAEVSLEEGMEEGDEGQWAVSAALDALGAYRELALAKLKIEEALPHPRVFSMAPDFKAKGLGCNRDNALMKKKRYKGACFLSRGRLPSVEEVWMNPQPLASGRLSRGLHAERAAAAAASASHAHAHHLRNRHRYALQCALQEAGVARAYAFWALERIPGQLAARAAAHNRLAYLWGQLHATVQTTR